MSFLRRFARALQRTSPIVTTLVLALIFALTTSVARASLRVPGATCRLATEDLDSSGASGRSDVQPGPSFDNWTAVSSSPQGDETTDSGLSSSPAETTGHNSHLPDLSIDKRHVVDFEVGQNASFTLAVRNVGDAASNGTITLVDALPSGLTFVSATGSGWTVSTSGRTVTARFGSAIARGDSAVLVLVVAVGPSAAPRVINSATISGGGDCNSDNNCDTDKVDVRGTPDLKISLKQKNHPCVGDTARYLVTVENCGSSPTSGVITVLDTLPAGLTFVRGSGSGWSFEVDGQVVRATHPGPIAPGSSRSYTLYLAVDVRAYPEVLHVVNVSGGGDRNPANNRAVDKLDVCGKPDLRIDKQHAEDFRVGENGQFTIVVSNEGVVPTTGTITVRDTLPNSLTFVSASGAGWTFTNSGQIVTATYPGPLDPGASASFTLIVSVGPGAAPEVCNAATVFGGGDCDRKNDRDEDCVKVEGGKPDLIVDIKHKNSPCVGDTARYLVRVTNRGTATTTGSIVVVDTLPPGLSFVRGAGVGWTFSVDGNVVRASHPGPIPPGSTLDFQLYLLVGPAAYPSVTTTVTVSGGGDANDDNNRDSDSQPICGRPDLSIRLTHENQPCVGDLARFRVVVLNVGTGPTVGLITVRDTLPTGLMFVSGSGSGWTIGNAGQVVIATHPGPLEAGDSLGFTFEALVGEAAQPSVVTAATVSGGGDRNRLNDRDTDLLKVCGPQSPDLAIDKRHTADFVVGQNGLYTIVVTNVGTLATTGTITV
ncbi:MAG: DUF11 domain-containing protein, partial [Candidatus Eisenbacteria bacterium]|nr:DUF11 domain-containing protein [Candidatus Eisenbacteria bacterium]